MVPIVRFLILAYQWTISPVLTFLAGPGNGCRFQPTCSRYFLEAVETYGVLQGSWLGLRRLGRCHPWGGQGLDPVPEKTGENVEPRTSNLERRTAKRQAVRTQTLCGCE